jgi:ArsR family transcriptional regulator
MDRVFKAIADPTRRDVLRLLSKREMTAGQLAEHFEMTKPTMSHHFAVLKEADLIYARREAQTIWYALNTTVVQDILRGTLDLAQSRNGGGRRGR